MFLLFLFSDLFQLLVDFYPSNLEVWNCISASQTVSPAAHKLKGNFQKPSILFVGRDISVVYIVSTTRTKARRGEDKWLHFTGIIVLDTNCSQTLMLIDLLWTSRQSNHLLAGAVGGTTERARFTAVSP